jgi:hypothetical protein
VSSRGACGERDSQQGSAGGGPCKPADGRHLSGMLRTRWLNSLRADIVRPLPLGWCAARRMSWSQKPLISAAAGREADGEAAEWKAAHQTWA